MPICHEHGKSMDDGFNSPVPHQAKAAALAAFWDFPELAGKWYDANGTLFVCFFPISRDYKYFACCKFMFCLNLDPRHMQQKQPMQWMFDTSFAASGI